MAGTTKLDVGKVITYILLLMLLALVFSFLAFFTNGFTSDFKTFYVVYRDETILNDKTDYMLLVNTEHRFDVKYTFGFMQRNKKLGYNVKVVPNITDETKFDFVVNGHNYPYSSVEDLTKCFDVKKYDDYFTLSADKDLPDMLSMLYLNEPVSNAPKAISSDKAYFALIISSEDEKIQIRITFKLETLRIILDPDKVVF